MFMPEYTSKSTLSNKFSFCDSKLSKRIILLGKSKIIFAIPIFSPLKSRSTEPEIKVTKKIIISKNIFNFLAYVFEFLTFDIF